MTLRNRATPLRPAPPLVIVCGVSRSGTSLVHAMIGAHSDALPLRETHLFRFYQGCRRSRRLLERCAADERCRLLLHDSYLAREPEIARLLVADAAAGLPVGDWYPRLVALAGEIGTAARPGFARGDRRAVVVDKDPRYLDHLSALHQLLPEARFVVCARPAVAVLASKQATSWSGHRPAGLNAAVGALQSAGLVRALRRSPSLARQVVLVGYDAIVDQPEATLLQLMRHVGLDGPPPMPEQWRRMADRLVMDDERDRKDRTREKVEGCRRRTAEQAALARRPALRRLGAIQDRLAAATARAGGVVQGDEALCRLDLRAAGRMTLDLAGGIYLALVASGALSNRAEARRRRGDNR